MMKKTNNYFKVRGSRELTYGRTNPEPQNTLEWKAQMAERTKRIVSIPAQKIHWDRFFFFNDADAFDIQKAWRSALSQSKGDSGKISVAKELRSEWTGPWVLAMVVGEFPIHKSMV